MDKEKHMEGDLQKLADESAKKDYTVDDNGDVISANDATDDLEETRKEADKLEKEFEFPGHHKRMTRAQLSEALTNIEREKSRQGNELGDLRKQVDELLKAPAIERKPIEAEQLLESPDETIQSAISDNDKLKSLEARVTKYEADTVKSQFYQKHPDADELASSQEFQNYLNVQPLAAKAAAIAAQKNDYEILNDVMDSFKSFKGQALREESSQKREEQLHDARLESGSTGGSSKKVYNRNDLVQLRIRDPEKWAANEAVYMKAYAEGRVK